jgi:type IX secretion system PorP/SprF family membrane protein
MGIEGAPITNTLNITTSLSNEKVGLGLLAINDRFGISNNLELTGAVSYKIKFNKNQLSFGMQGGFINQRYDYSKLNLEFPDQTLTQQKDNAMSPTVGAGLFIRSERYYAGFSVPRILNNTTRGDGKQYNRSYYLTGGIVIEKFTSLKIRPSVVIKATENESTPVSVDFNTSVLLRDVVWAGLSTRNLKSLGANVQFDLNIERHMLRIGYAYELPNSSLRSESFGSHELLLLFELGRVGQKEKTVRYF